MANSNQGNNGGNQGGNQGGKQDDNKQSGSQGDTSNRGFASMDPEKQREIASEGGRAAHASGNAHEFDSDEAREAGRMSHKNNGNQQSGGKQSGSASGSGSSSKSPSGNQQSGARGSNTDAGSGGKSSGGGIQGGTPEQHAEAGRQSRKNTKE